MAGTFDIHSGMNAEDHSFSVMSRMHEIRQGRNLGRRSLRGKELGRTEGYARNARPKRRHGKLLGRNGRFWDEREGFRDEWEVKA